eukprot:scaffold160_cov234-Chaetoceros_neogracile.AAC.4
MKGDLIGAIERDPNQDYSEGMGIDLFEPVLQRNPAVWMKDKTEESLLASRHIWIAAITSQRKRERWRLENTTTPDIIF